MYSHSNRQVGSSPDEMHYSMEMKDIERSSQLEGSRNNNAQKLLDQECPIVWRWVPFHANHGDSGISSLSQPRVIYATSKKVGKPEPSPLLTGGELREARELLIRSKVNSLIEATSATEPSPLSLRIPHVPRNIPPHVNLVRHTQHQVLLESQGASGNASNGMNSSSKRAETAGGELEVANLLLNMGGGSSPKSGETAQKKKQTTKKTALPSRPKGQTGKSAADKKPSLLEDTYLDNWVAGSISLHTPEDDDVLSPLHCFMRRYCVEAFSATPEDVATPRYGKSHGFKVEVGQVGIRCLHCKDLPPSKRAERAVCYPSSLRNIYHSIETWQRRHSLVCKCINPWVRKSILELMESSKTRAGGRRQYWEDSARRLGMVDTSQGVRFCRKPGDLGPIPSPGSGRLPGEPDVPQHEPEKIVRKEDKDLVTDYLFLLMDQMQTCQFTEEDRTGGRSKIKDNEVGFPGMECRHCQGRAGFGRYFPSSVAALSLANSDRNVYNHLQKCRKCPESVKTELIRLQKTQAQSKNRRGLRKLFFNRIWKRMHKVDKDDSENSRPSESGLVGRQQLPQGRPGEFVQYSFSQLPPAIMNHSYQHTMHPQVAVHNFRRY
ncbi:unnamed protein product [Pseudo-nitzschia multistriata]|uniref:Uncharacterized protein n=1 Tax=Pseudo-nitzschia multistriata TaxID=183589 RepID=A0A448ZPC4_9STRA|nr:unnamed protein product [Pseudo-nitzschia multistriata]